MQASLPTLQICHQHGMYGDCKDASAHVGEHQIGDAHYDHLGKRWLVSIHNVDGTVDNHIVDFVESREATLELVDILFRLNFRSNYAANRRAA